MRSQIDRPRGGTSNIFINYRREDSAGHAGRLFDALSEIFPGRLFMDIDTLDPGVDFVEAIEQAVIACQVLIVVIGREWISIQSAPGRRRLDNPGDFVRLELESALARKIRVIPVLVQGAQMPHLDELPPSLAPLARRNAIELSDARWAYDVERLSHTLQEVLAEKDGSVTGAMAAAAQPTLPSGHVIPAVVRPAGSRNWLIALAALGLVSTVVLAAMLWLRRPPSGGGLPSESTDLGSPTNPARPGAVPPASGATPATGASASEKGPAVDPVVQPAEAPAPAPVGTPPVAEPERKRPATAKEPAKTPAKGHPSEPGRKTLGIPSDDKPAEPTKPRAEPREEKPAPRAVAVPRVTITAPGAGATVGSSVQVEGTAFDLGDHKIFLCIRQSNGRIYPRGELFPKDEGKWTIPLRSSKEKTFEILVVAANREEAIQLLREQTSRDNGLAPLPAGSTISSGAVVLKRRKLGIFG